MEEDTKYTQVALVLLGDGGCGVTVVSMNSGALPTVICCTGLGLADWSNILLHQRRLLWHFLVHEHFRALPRQLT